VNDCAKCGGKIPWRIRNNEGREISLTKRKFCLSCSPLYSHNTRSLPHRIAHEAGERICPRCKTKKPLLAFYRRTDGRPACYCRKCTQDQVQERHIAFKKKAVAYKGGACMRCEFIGPAVCYDFHHRDRTTKKVEISRMRKGSWKAAVNELNKCDLLCANCHRIVEYESSRTGPVF
jgi:hypothetical protein